MSEIQSFSKALLVHVELFQHDNNDIAELDLLAQSAGIEPVEHIVFKRSAPDTKHYIGKGKAQEIADIAKAQDIPLIIINDDLSPTQQRNLENLLCVFVMDRTQLILDIFAQRARTYEGRLQVELAQLEHLSTRLIRGWTHLERQKGGIGLRGPGETQLETDRRLIRDRIKLIKKRLEKVVIQRQQGRKSRKKSNVKTVALVGYTNAGKSTLFNVLSGGDVYMQDQLFATLDPTVRQLAIPNFGEVVLADTVGFVKGLPHQLVNAFKATLEEVVDADLLLHVVDASDLKRIDHCQKVQEVLTEIGAQDVPSLYVYNKIDLLDGQAQPRVDLSSDDMPQRVWVSAKSALGFDELLGAISSALSDRSVSVCVVLLPKEAQARAWLHQQQAIVSEKYLEDGSFQFELKLSQHQCQRLLQLLT
jgi:GTPase